MYVRALDQLYVVRAPSAPETSGKVNQANGTDTDADIDSVGLSVGTQALVPAPVEVQVSHPDELDGPDLEITQASRGWLASWMRLSRSTRSIIQGVVTTLLLGVGVPLLVMLALYRFAGVDISGPIHLTVTVALLYQAGMIWWESALGLKDPLPPETMIGPPPPAAIIIAAYLPNEQGIVLDTVYNLLNQEYRGTFKVILAYNSPVVLPVEEELNDLAILDDRFIALRVEGSTSKAENVNAALAHLGDARILGIYDADHMPETGTLERAARWLTNGFDIVQGRCVVTNGDASWSAKLVAVEFEQIYGISHPGRTRMHKWGIFGGTNGYWRVDTFNAINGFDEDMLTEDIDSAVRSLIAGFQVATDRGIVSRELGTTTLKALWAQRMRWAQGWFQVSLKHGRSFFRAEHFTARQKFGGVKMFAWREAYPWLSLQMWPVLAFWLITRQGIDWFRPIWLATSTVTILTGPLSAVMISRIRDRGIKRRWIVFYALATLLYVEFKNTIVRIAHMKQLMGESEWVVTARVLADKKLEVASVGGGT